MIYVITEIIDLNEKENDSNLLTNYKGFELNSCWIDHGFDIGFIVLCLVLNYVLGCK